jgi:hypothetical protein
MALNLPSKTREQAVRQSCGFDPYPLTDLSQSAARPSGTWG